jgi:hypothetical protein
MSGQILRLIPQRCRIGRQKPAPHSLKHRLRNPRQLAAKRRTHTAKAVTLSILRRTSDKSKVASAMRSRPSGSNRKRPKTLRQLLLWSPHYNPAVGIPLALDDLQASIRRHDIPGIPLAAASFVPGARAARLLRRRPKVSTAKLFSPAASNARAISSITPKDSAGRVRLKKAGIDHLTPRVAPEKAASMIRNGSAVRDGNELTFRSVSALRRAIGGAPTGHDWHHLAEQRKSNSLSAHQKHRTDNVVTIPKPAHRKVGAVYSTKSRHTGLLFPHELNGLSFDAQHTIGIKVLLKFLKGISRKAP